MLAHFGAFDHFMVAHKVESKQVGTSLFDSGAVCFQSIGVYTRQQLARGVSQTLVQVGMQVARKVGVFVYKLYLGGTPVELFGKAVAFGYLAVCFGEVSISCCTIWRPSAMKFLL